MSIRLLQSPDDAIHDVADDIQSFIYVALWAAARYAPNAMTVEDRCDFLERFDYRQAAPARQKIDFLRGSGAVNDLKLETQPFSMLLQLLARFTWYSIDHDREWVNAVPEFSGVIPDTEVEEMVGRLQRHDWMAETLEKKLESEEWRQTRDGAVEHPVSLPALDTTGPEKRRKSSMDGYSASGSTKRSRVR